MSVKELIINAIASATSQNTKPFRPPIYSLLPSEYKQMTQQQNNYSLPPIHNTFSDYNYSRDRSRSRERDRSRSRERGRSHSRERDYSRDRGRGHSREKDRSRSRERHISSRHRSRSRERHISSRHRSRSRERHRSRSRERHRSRSRDRHSRREIEFDESKPHEPKKIIIPRLNKFFTISPEKICNHNNCLEHKLKICMKLHSDQIAEINYLFVSTNNIKLVNEKINKFYNNARCNYYNKKHQPQYFRNIASQNASVPKGSQGGNTL